jgi:hypothetical protein
MMTVITVMAIQRVHVPDAAETVESERVLRCKFSCREPAAHPIPLIW